MRLAAACLAVLAWCVQPAHSAEQEDVVAETWMVQSVIDVQNVGAPDLYERARVWAVWAFRDSDTVLEIEEPGTLLMGKVTIAYNSRKIMGSATRWGHIRCVVKIDFQDARLRFTLTECTHEASPKNPYPTSFGLLTTGEGPTPEACSRMPMPGKCGSRYYRRVFGEMKELAETTATTMLTSLTEAVQNPTPSESDDW
jgi:hypothetical protein